MSGPFHKTMACSHSDFCHSHADVFFFQKLLLFPQDQPSGESLGAGLFGISQPDTRTSSVSATGCGGLGKGLRASEPLSARL